MVLTDFPALSMQPVALRPLPSNKLASVRTFFTCQEGGACQVGHVGAPREGARRAMKDVLLVS